VKIFGNNSLCKEHLPDKQN